MIFGIYTIYTKIHNKKQTMMTTKEKENIQNEINQLELTLTGDMFKDMDTKDKIFNLNMKLNGTKPSDTQFECVGCSS